MKPCFISVITKFNRFEVTRTRPVQTDSLFDMIIRQTLCLTRYVCLIFKKSPLKSELCFVDKGNNHERTASNLIGCHIDVI